MNVFKKLMILFFVVNFFSCGFSSDVKEIQILFAPSFHHPMRFIINIEGKTIEQYQYQDRYYIKEWLDSNTYKLHKKDTLIVHYKKIFSIEEADLYDFIKHLEASKLDTTIVYSERILDGIGYRISKINNVKDTITLTSNLSLRNKTSSQGYIILDSFFNLLDNTIDDYDGASRYEQIQDYFEYNLPIKKISNNPIEYRIWGSISGCKEDNKEFLNFLKNLPKNEPVIFDLRNGSIAYCLNNVLEKYCENRMIFFYGDRSMNESKEIMDEIKVAESKGEVLSSLRISAYETHKMIYEGLKNNKKIKRFETKIEVLDFIKNEL